MVGGVNGSWVVFLSSWIGYRLVDDVCWLKVDVCVGDFTMVAS